MPKNEVEKETLLSLREKLLIFAENYREICEKIYRVFQENLKGQNLDLGKMRIYLVGGRTSDKPIKNNTDLDFRITFDQNSKIVFGDRETRYKIMLGIFNIFVSYGLYTDLGVQKTLFRIMEGADAEDPRLSLTTRKIPLFDRFWINLPENDSFFNIFAKKAGDKQLKLFESDMD